MGYSTIDNLVKRHPWLAGVVCFIVMEKLWINFLSTVSFLMHYGVQFLMYLGSIGNAEDS